MPKNFKHWDFSDAQLFWVEMKKKSAFITFPSRLKFPKLPNFYPNLRKKSHEYF